METNERLGAMTPDASRTMGAIAALMSEIEGSGLDAQRMRELVARVSAPMLGLADEGDWKAPHMPLVTWAKIRYEGSDHDNY